MALTFSINAAYKIRKDVEQQLPLILSASPNYSHNAVQMVYATNYHGLSRRILSRFGYLISPNLSQIDSLRGVGIDISDDEAYMRGKFQRNLIEWSITLSKDEIDLLLLHAQSVKAAGDPSSRKKAIEFLSQRTNEYLQIVKEKFLPNGYIIFDAVLLYVRKLFRDFDQIRSFYRDFFPIIIVDEFQDTNILQWALLQDLVGRGDDAKNQLFVFGDRYQKIYEFIGAMEGIVDQAKTKYQMQEIPLKTNHRFRTNQPLLAFDHNVRKTAQNPWRQSNDFDAILQVIHARNQDDEAEKIIDRVMRILELDPNCSVAILTRAGKDNKNTNKLVEHCNLRKAIGFSYFFALYSDEDQEYIDFHRKCLLSLYESLPNCRSLRNLCNRIQERLEVETPSETWISLQILLETFWNHIFHEFRFLTLDEKVDLMVDTFRNNSLKQYLMYVTNIQVTLSTVHGSKGLEWDYVLLPDMEKIPSLLTLDYVELVISATVAELNGKK